MDAYKCSKSINRMHGKFMTVVSFREREGTGKMNTHNFSLMCSSYFILCKKNI